MIQQRATFDCLICCVAMATGATYEDVMAAAVEADLIDPAKGTKATDLLLSRLGYSHRQLNTETGGDFSVRYRPASLDAAWWRQMMTWGRRAILCVPSLNHPGEQHAVYWDGEQLHDPSTLKAYESWDQLAPEEITLFNEGCPRG